MTNSSIYNLLICRLAAILNNARSRVMPRWSNVYPGHFHRGLVPLHETIEKFRVHQNVYGVVGQGLDYVHIIGQMTFVLK